MKAEEAEAEGRAKGRSVVRAVLIEPLEADGMVRNPRETAGAHAAMLDRLCDRLAYLTGAQLATLREVVLRAAEGEARNRWPAFATIWNLAVRMYPPPDEEDRLIASWFASVEGPKARAEGYLVELYRFLRRMHRPPSAYEMKALREDAAEAARRRVRVEEWLRAGRAQASDQEWLQGYRAVQARCERLVAAGEERRISGREGQAA